MATQTPGIAGVGAERRNGLPQGQVEVGSAFNAWLKDFGTPNVDQEGRLLPSDSSLLAQRALRLRGSIPLSGPIPVEVPAISYIKEGGKVVQVIQDEPRVARVEVAPVGAGLGRDVQLALVIRNREDDYKAEPTETFDPLAAARQSLRARRIEVVPLGGKDGNLAAQLIGETALARLDGQVTTIDRQVRTYLAASI